jgi:hypothetical protein
MISDNINKAFFEGEIPLHELKEINNGLVERKEKGTLRLLEEWLSANYNLPEPYSLKELFKIFKEIRKERQHPAHKITRNKYDKALIAKQTELIKEAYFTMKTLRQIFQLHPLGKTVEVEKWLDSENIKPF